MVADMIRKPWWITGLATIALSISSAYADIALDELKHWHEKIVTSRGTVSIQDAQAALNRINAWDTNLDQLDENVRTQYIELNLHSHLAVGDAAAAAELLPKLEESTESRRRILRSQWLVAYATGDAQLAEKTLAELRKLRLTRNEAIHRREKRLRMVGHQAPDTSVVIPGRPPIPLRNRGGQILLIDFWTLREEPTPGHIAALCALHDEYARDPYLRFLGINKDSRARVEQAQQFATQRRYAWPQHYEQHATFAPITDQEFRVASFPWQVIIDQFGNIRAVGHLGEEGFHYALRAALAEAKDKFPPVRPKTTTGELAPIPEQKPNLTPTNDPDEDASQDLPRNPEARALLDKARLYLKTGRRTDAKRLLRELIEKYPNTWEAEQARNMGLV